MNRLSVVLPCYNEREAIESVVQEAIAFGEKVKRESVFSDFELIVVDDGSTDGSMDLISKIPNIHRIRFPKNLGYGAALKAGIRNSKGDWIAFYDLDGTCHPEDMLSAKSILQNSEPYMLSGVRLGEDTGMPALRQFGNWIFKSLTSLLLGKKVSDACSGFRILHREYAKDFVEKLPDKLNFTLAMTVFSLRNGYNYHEFSVNYSERLGTSKLSALVEGVRFLGTIFKYRFSANFK